MDTLQCGALARSFTDLYTPLQCRRTEAARLPEGTIKYATTAATDVAVIYGDIENKVDTTTYYSCEAGKKVKITIDDYFFNTDSSCADGFQINIKGNNEDADYSALVCGTPGDKDTFTSEGELLQVRVTGTTAPSGPPEALKYKVECV
ncbi:uncharacterized protein LOC141914224 [Tubulanus polymorphus]|uniref:uncharacterized protein LOC141914224 n=1 Tax=Tubulanus polymorphus TaxID=672921 RepID=UPI003DA24824